MMNFLKSNKKKNITFLLIILASFILYLNSTIAFLFYKKVIIHRVNSIEKLNEVKNKFIGVELDLIYDSHTRKLDVNHPPALSINLDLNDYLAQSKDIKNLIYWLDYKNIDVSNKTNSLIALDKIVEKFKIPKNKIIIESSYPEHIQVFKKGGYITSYYLPPFLYNKSRDSLNILLNHIRIQTKKFPTDYISFDSKNFPIIKKNFPKLKKISWQSGDNQIMNKLLSKILVYEALLDKNVDYMLIPFESKKFER